MSRHVVVGLILAILAGVLVFVVSQSSTKNISTAELTEPVTAVAENDRSKRFATVLALPVAGSAPVHDSYHTITLEEIRQGCFRQDCIPSVDSPEFVASNKLSVVLPADSLGIALTYKDQQRFYPFPMLETRELVNDVVDGDPLLISYCPLCGTGIVFDRTVDGEIMEFGVSGMLWNSNVLMYNRASDVADRNLWSQVLGEAVVGARAGETLSIIPSEIMRFSDWNALHSSGLVLDTGSIADPYQGQYYVVASQFQPNFDETASLLEPNEYVYGLFVSGVPLAVTQEVVQNPVATLRFNGALITFTQNEAGLVEFFENGTALADKEGFWFSFKAAYPDAMVWDDATINSL